MIEKLLVLFADSDAVIAVKYNRVRKRCVVGSNVRFNREMQSVIIEYFRQDHVPRARLIQKNKVRYEFDLPIGTYDDGVNLLKEHGIIVQNVKRHGRIMR